MVINLLNIQNITSQNKRRYECMHERRNKVIIGDFVDVSIYKSLAGILEGMSYVYIIS